MRRRFRSRGHGRPTRKTYWTSGTYLGSNVPFETNNLTGADVWYSAWAIWPGGSFTDPQLTTPSPQPSDTTLVRTLVEGQVALDNGGDAGYIAPAQFCFGLIAFDGSRNPELYDNNTGGTDDPIAPPCPLFDQNEDWIIRVPTIFTFQPGLSTEKTVLYQQSMAKRKLPPGHGVLAVVQASMFFDRAVTYHFNFGFDMRFAMKSGYTTPI